MNIEMKSMIVRSLNSPGLGGTSSEPVGTQPSPEGKSVPGGKRLALAAEQGNYWTTEAEGNKAAWDTTGLFARFGHYRRPRRICKDGFGRNFGCCCCCYSRAYNCQRRSDKKCRSTEHSNSSRGERQ